MWQIYYIKVLSKPWGYITVEQRLQELGSPLIFFLINGMRINIYKK